MRGSPPQSRATLRALADVLEHTLDALVTVDTLGKIRVWNVRAAQVFGWSAEEALGQDFFELLVPAHIRGSLNTRFSGFFTQGRQEALGRVDNLMLRGREDSAVPVCLHAAVVLLSEGRFVNLFVKDLSDEVESQARIMYEASHDPLTGLLNRRAFSELLGARMNQATKHGQRVGVVFVDIDHLKYVNDSLGHAAGDELIRVMAERVASMSAGCTLARFGADEFVVAVPDAGDGSRVIEVADRIVRAAQEAVVLGGQPFHTSVSVGVVVQGHGHNSPDDLLRDADSAVHSAKEGGRNRTAVFEEKMRRLAFQRVETERALRRAVRNEEFFLVYQPTFDAGGRLTGFEALVRWDSPERGIVSPLEFIPMAESTGLIVPLGAWVLRQAVRTRAAWGRHHPACEEATISVNISAGQLHDASFLNVLADVLAETGLPAEKIVLEMTESVLMADAAAVTERLKQLKALGVRLAVDDFGTGYSSLAYLQRFPVDVLKIDRAFVKNLPESQSDLEIAKLVITLAKTLKLGVVAEGVETLGQLQALTSLGCDVFQGYYFAKPLGEREAGMLLASLDDENVTDSHIRPLGAAGESEGLAVAMLRASTRMSS